MKFLNVINLLCCALFYFSSNSTFADDTVVLKNTPAIDRMHEEITVDVSYNLNIPSSYWEKKTARNNSFDSVMIELHGCNIYNDPQLHEFIKSRNFPSEVLGFTLPSKFWINHFETKKPKIILEVGVFHGFTSTAMAKKMKEIPGMEQSIVISMDTWLNDLRFVWNSDLTFMYRTKKMLKFFDKRELGGSPDLYYRFLNNVLKTDTQDRIIPMQSSSLNGAMELIAHGILPDFMYIDASHCNPDVLIDFINFYEILAPGGTMAIDDKTFPAIASAITYFESKYNNKFISLGVKTAYINKPKS